MQRPFNFFRLACPRRIKNESQGKLKGKEEGWKGGNTIYGIYNCVGVRRIDELAGSI